jgi:sulfatase modifying factor 1
MSSCETTTGLMTALYLVFTMQPVWAQSTFKDCADCPDMVAVAAGNFEMGAATAENVREGSPERYIQWESPVHRVDIRHPFAVSVAEVTRAQFAAFVNETGYSATSCDIAKGNDWDSRADKSWKDPGFVQNNNHPVVCVNWHDAKAYVTWLATNTGKPYRLLTEAEWEYIARAGTTTARFWGDDRMSACKHANVPDRSIARTTSDPQIAFNCEDGFIFTSPAKSFAPNAFGLYDTIGNVWEWVEDCFHDSYTTAPNDGSAWQPEADCQHHVARGGSWNPRLASQLRSAARGRVTTTLRNSNLGIRVALTL